MIELKHISLIRGHRNLIDHLSVSIERGECVIFEGQNGSGKSSLVKSLIGRLEPHEGQIIIDARNLYRLAPKERKTYFRSSGIVLQEVTLRPFDSIERSLTHRNVNPEELRLLLEDLGFYDRKSEHVDHLSFAERRRLDLGRSLITHPRLLIWDNPFLGLDRQTEEYFLNKLKELKESGVTVLLFTHDASIFNILNPEKIIRI